MPNKNDNSNLESVDKLIENTFDRLKDIIDANTIIGKTIKVSDKVSIIPVSKVSVGLVTGGGQMPVKKKNVTNLGSTTGFSVIPIGFLSINDVSIQFVSTELIDSSTNKLIDTFMSVYDKFLTKNGESNEEN